jgi:hypothetical protein
MKTLLFFLLALTASAQQPADLSKHFFFKHLVGDWKAEGELKGEDNKIVTITEDWKGNTGGDGTFLLEGKRTINSETKSFKWTFTHNPATDTFDAVLEGEPGDQPLRFEATISEVNLTLELKAITGTNSAITVKEEFTDEKHETISSHVTFTGDDGQTTLEGTITHKKMKAP